MRIVLASASPRRRELLEQIGLKFEVAVSNVQEHVTASEPEKVVEELSEQKAEAVLDILEREQRTLSGHTLSEKRRGQAAPEHEIEDEIQDEILIIGADTVVSVDGNILGKPADKEDAVRMLAMLSGRSHEVYTGVTLIYWTASGQMLRKTFHERTDVIFYSLSVEEIDGYVSTGDCMDKAGAYGIQGFCARYIKEIRGDYNNVVGLPVGRLYQEAKNLCGKNF